MRRTLRNEQHQRDTDTTLVHLSTVNCKRSVLVTADLAITRVSSSPHPPPNILLLFLMLQLALIYDIIYYNAFVFKVT